MCVCCSPWHQGIDLFALWGCSNMTKWIYLYSNNIYIIFAQYNYPDFIFTFMLLLFISTYLTILYILSLINYVVLMPNMFMVCGFADLILVSKDEYAFTLCWAQYQSVIKKSTLCYLQQRPLHPLTNTWEIKKNKKQKKRMLISFFSAWCKINHHFVVLFV